MPEILPNPFTDPKKLPKRSLFDVKKDEHQDFIDQAMAKGLEAAQESLKKKFTDPELQKIWDEIEEKIENGEIKLHEIIIGGKTKEQLIQEIEAAGMRITDDAKQMMESKEFKISDEEKNLELIALSLADFGFSDGATMEKIYQRAKKLGLEIVSAEVGPQMRLQYVDQPMDEYLVIGMEPMSDYPFLPRVFKVNHSDHGRSLSYNDGHPDLEWDWDSNHRFVFVRK